MTQNFYPSPTKITRRLFFPSRNFIWASRGSEARSVYTSNYAVITSSATVTRHLMNTGELLCAAGDVFCCCAAAGQQKRRKLCSPPTTSIPTSSVWIPSELDPLTLCPLSPGPGPAPPSILLGTRPPTTGPGALTSPQLTESRPSSLQSDCVVKKPHPIKKKKKKTVSCCCS